MSLWIALDSLVREHLPEAHLRWWEKSTLGPLERTATLAALSGTGRRFGPRAVDVPEERLGVSLAQGLLVQGRPWAELGRVALLLSAGERAQAHVLPDLADEAYRTGDLQEKQAVLRALAHLPGPQRFRTIAAEGARANALAIFEAIALDNPFPAAHFSDDALNQLVMKAIFNGFALGRIMGLPARMNADLTRMARDYGNERRAAGRPISEDLAVLENKGAKQ